MAILSDEVIVAGGPFPYLLDARVVPDTYPGCGPLGVSMPDSRRHPTPTAR